MSIRWELILLKGLILLVGARGFEPPTSCSQSRRATRLRYAPKINIKGLLPLFLNLCKNKFYKSYKKISDVLINRHETDLYLAHIHLT